LNTATTIKKAADTLSPILGNLLVVIYLSESLVRWREEGKTMSRFPKKFASILCMIVCLLLLVGLLSQMLKFYLFSGYEASKRFEPLLKLVDLNRENNLPTWYSSTALFVNSVFVGLIGWVKRHEGAPYAKHWLGLAGIFLLLSADEAASIHELTSGTAVRLLERVDLMSDYFYYGWVIFGIVAVMIVGVLYLQFLMDLPKETRLWFLFAGFLYVGGAIRPLA